VIALAYKSFDPTGIDIATLHREHVERDLEFAGFLIFDVRAPIAYRQEAYGFAHSLEFCGWLLVSDQGGVVRSDQEPAGCIAYGMKQVPLVELNVYGHRR